MTFTEFLKKIPATTAALSAAVVALTKLVLQKRLIPDNVDWLTSAGILVSIIAFLCVFARLIPEHAKRWLIGLAAFSLISLICVQVVLVEDFRVYEETYHELRGWKLSENGEKMKARLEKEGGNSLSTHDIIEQSGHTEMVALYGSNWYLSVALYAGSFLVLLFSVIGVAGRFELDAKDSAGHSAAGSQPVSGRGRQPSKLVIHSANYMSITGEGTPYDVVPCLRQMIKGDRLDLDIENHNFVTDDGHNCVPKDPKRGTEKRLLVTYSYDGGPQITTERLEGSRIELPEPSAIPKVET